MSTGKALGITIVVSLLLAAGGLYFLAKPKYDANQEAQKNLAKMQADIKELEPYRASLADVDREIASYKQQLESMRKIVPAEKQADGFIKDVQQEASKAGVIIRRYTSKPVSTREHYAEMPFEVEVDGRYYQVLNFFQGVHRMERIVNITNVQMSNPEKGSQNIKLKKKYAYGPEETVVATCQATTYFTPPAPAPGSQPAGAAGAPPGAGGPGRPGGPGGPPVPPAPGR
jgi:type IV pilus assembly protein PilO